MISKVRSEEYRVYEWRKMYENTSRCKSSYGAPIWLPLPRHVVDDPKLASHASGTPLRETSHAGYGSAMTFAPCRSCIVDLYLRTRRGQTEKTSARMKERVRMVQRSHICPSFAESHVELYDLRNLQRQKTEKCLNIVFTRSSFA
jgi:hypothetical protein